MISSDNILHIALGVPYTICHIYKDFNMHAALLYVNTTIINV